MNRKKYTQTLANNYKKGGRPHLLASILINGRFTRLNQMWALITHFAHVLTYLVPMKLLSWPVMLDGDLAACSGDVSGSIH